MFGAPAEQPDHADRALACRPRAARAVRALAGGLDAAIGVATGTAVAGYIGAETRFEYTVIGDPVNEAARLSEVAKERPDAAGRGAGRSTAPAAARPPAGCSTARSPCAGAARRPRLARPVGDRIGVSDTKGAWTQPPPTASPGSRSPMSRELPEDLQGLFRAARERIGFVPNVFRTYAYRPERLSAWFSHFRLLHEETQGLSAAEREMIAVVVSMANGCLYCLVAHGAALREAWGDPVMADRITLDWRRADGLTERQRAICAFAEKLTLQTGGEHRGRPRRRCARTGSPTQDAWDVIEVAAMYNFTNRLALATGQIPNPEYHALAR